MVLLHEKTLAMLSPEKRHGLYRDARMQCDTLEAFSADSDGDVVASLSKLALLVVAAVGAWLLFLGLGRLLVDWALR